MKEKEIRKFQSDVALSISRGELHDAFAAMRSFSEGGLTWEITTEIDRLEGNYRAMLSYLSTGADDPERDQVYASIVAEARSIAEVLARHALIAEGSSLYFSTLRRLSARPGQSPATAVAALRAELRRLDADISSIADSRRSVAAENLAIELFDRLWTTHPLTAEDVAAVRDFVLEPGLPEPPRALAVAALSLGALEYYDDRRAEALLRIYIDADSDVVALRALIGFCVFAFRYRLRPMSRRLADVLAAAKDSPRWTSDLKIAAIEFMRTRDTARISDRLSNDIIPTLTKLAPEIKDKFSDGFDPAEIAEGGNPEWNDLLGRDGLGDKLREMTEIQAEGGDVYMTTFRALKYFPFFREAANWFLPFSTGHSEVASADNFEGTASTQLARLPFLCDSDKFSVMMAMAAAPTGHRDTIFSAMENQASQMHDMLSELEKADEATRRVAVVNSYLRDMYRFYNLFRRKADFFNPFANGIDLMSIDSLAGGFDDTDTLSVIAEFNLKHGFWAEAAQIFKKIDAAEAPDAERAQKIGYCLEMTGNFAGALSFYEEADMLGSSSAWLLGRLARTYRALGEARRAIGVYRRLEELNPDDARTALALGNTLVEARRPDEAEPLFHKALYLDTASKAARRGLAWTQLLNGKLDAAAANYDALIADNPSAEDYLNAGHAARARRQMRDAINYYILSIQTSGKTPTDLAADLVADAAELTAAGIEVADDTLILEAIRYATDSSTK